MQWIKNFRSRDRLNKLNQKDVLKYIARAIPPKEIVKKRDKQLKARINNSADGIRPLHKSKILINIDRIFKVSRLYIWFICDRKLRIAHTKGR